MTGHGNEAFAKLVSERVPPSKAREAVEAAADVLEWRYGYAWPERVVRLARLMIQHERTPAKPQFELFNG
jgi:hypothetical protein